MSLLSSLFSGVTGMTAYGNAMSIIGNNIANVNTSGFKAGRPIFGDILSQSLGASSQIGRGVEMSKVDTLFQQGSFSTTENITDMAIDGSGFFAVRNNNGTFFTRAGNFHFDAGGYLVNPENLALQGSQIINGNVTGSVGDIRIENLTGTPRATGDGLNGSTGVQVAANLDSRVAPPLPFTVSGTSASTNFSTSITAYDSLGNGHLVNVYFRKNGTNDWEYHVTTDSQELSGWPGAGGPAWPPATAQQVEVGRGVLEFDPTGALNRIGQNASPAAYVGNVPTWGAVSYPAAATPLQLEFDFSGGAAQNQMVAFNFGDALTAGPASTPVANSTGKSGLTQYGSTSTVSYQKQDGYAVGSLRNISINQQGILTGIYTNGQTIDLYQIFLADFKSPSDLLKQGKNLFSQSKDSGEPIIGPPGTSGKGTVVANSIEMSNVDLAAEFVNMITTQRGFTANTRVISTSDQMLTELVNLKR
ncbi:MAG: flagellar hook protein FlgE [Candidatus Deferrimicrobiaceae bacterium]